MQKENNYRYLLFLLLVPVIVIMYLFRVKSRVGFLKNLGINEEMSNPNFEEVTPEESENLNPQPVFAQNGLNDRQMKVLEYVSRNGDGKVSNMVKLFSQTDRTLRRDLNKLEIMGFVKRNGSTKSVSYTLVK